MDLFHLQQEQTYNVFWIPQFPHFPWALFNGNEAMQGVGGAQMQTSNLLRWREASEGDKCHAEIKWFWELSEQAQPYLTSCCLYAAACDSCVKKCDDS